MPDESTEDQPAKLQKEVLASQRELHVLEKINIGANVSLLIVAIIAALIYRSQLRTANDAVELSKAIDAADRTPWLAFKVEKDVLSLQNVSATVHLVNSGKTPAREVRTAQAFFPLFGDADLQPSNFQEMEAYLQRALELDRPFVIDNPNAKRIGPSGLLTQPNEIGRVWVTPSNLGVVPPGASIPFDRKIVSVVNSSVDIRVYFFGLITYSDTAGLKHFTRYCIYQNAKETDMNFRPCRVYNDMK